MSEIFIRKWSELSGGRWDPKFVSYITKISTKFPLTQLKNLLKSNLMYGANEAGITRIDIRQPRYIRITDIDEFGCLKDEIGVTAKIIEPQYLLQENDILFARSGATVGKTYIHQNIDCKAFFAGYMIKCCIDSNQVLPYFVFLYTQLNIYKEWINAIQRISAQPNINAEEYGQLLIPLPPMQIQQQIIDIMDNAYKVKKDKEQQAQELLDSIDEYLMGELGIILPPKANNNLDSRIFTQKISALSGSRFDPSYHQEYYQDLEKALQRGKYPLMRLKEITNFIASGATPKSKGEDYEENGKYYFLRLVNFAPNLEVDLKNAIFVKEHIYNIDLSRVRVKKGDILFGIAGSIGKIAQYKHDLPAVINQAIAILRFKKNVFNNFALCILSSNIIKNQAARLQRPVAQPNINIQELESLKIPLPPLRVQEQIADEITHRRDRAKNLQQEAKEILESAKMEVEKMILGK